MKCRLCDRPTAAGSGKLCFDCTKALHRARGATQRKLASAQTKRVERAAAIDLPLTDAPPSAAAPSAKRRAGWVAIGVAAIAIAWFGQRELAGSTTPEPKIVDRLPSASAQPPASEPAPATPRIEEPSWTALGNAAEDANGPAGSKDQANAAKLQMSAAAGGARTGTKRATATNQDAKLSPSPASAGEAVAPPEPEPPQHLARANIAPAPADSAQALAGAMERCGKESLLTKFICEQKTYLAYCEDKWDKDPRCMRSAANSR
jgi:hypothetical protein